MKTFWTFFFDTLCVDFIDLIWGFFLQSDVSIPWLLYIADLSIQTKTKNNIKYILNNQPNTFLFILKGRFEIEDLYFVLSFSVKETDDKDKHRLSYKGRECVRELSK